VSEQLQQQCLHLSGGAEAPSALNQGYFAAFRGDARLNRPWWVGLPVNPDQAIAIVQFIA
jgi:hypothetical protein